MDDVQRDRIAAAVNMLRPEWPVPSLRTLMAKPELRNRPARDVAIALTWVACDPRTDTPGRVLRAGIWWQAAGITSERGSGQITMAQSCHCGRPLHEPDSDCQDPGRHRAVRRPYAVTVAEARAEYLAALERAKGAGEETDGTGP